VTWVDVGVGTNLAAAINIVDECNVHNVNDLNTIKKSQIVEETVNQIGGNEFMGMSEEMEKQQKQKEYFSQVCCLLTKGGSLRKP